MKKKKSEIRRNKNLANKIQVLYKFQKRVDLI